MAEHESNNAEAVADAMNARLLAAEQERRFLSLQEKYDSISKDLREKSETISSLEQTNMDLQSKVKEKDGALSALQDIVAKATRRAENAEEREKEINTRMARVAVETDSLREEISRLQNDNAALNSRISEANASSTLSSSSSAPLQFENSRLRAELESANGHRTWLENELHSRSKEIADMKAKFSETDHTLRMRLNEAKTTIDEYSAEISAQKLQNDSLKRRLDLSQRELLEREENHANSLHELRLELQSERRLVALNKENIVRLEERYNDAVREIETARSLASVAKQDHLRAIEDLRAEWEEDFNKRLLQSAEEYEDKIEGYKRQLDSASIEKAQLEDQLMSSGGVRVPQIEWNSDSDEPMTLTKLYEKLSEAEDMIRKERGERKKLELYLERVQKDVEAYVPRQMMERKEYEFAMAQTHEIQIRLNDALEERQRAITELHRVEKELSDTAREYDTCHRESNDLARQVQKLLQRSLEDGDLASEMAEQNRRLIQEHHRMSIEIDELNNKLDNDSVQRKLREFEAMKEEMENQATLVSNIIQQRDLYRALLSKHDSKLLADASGGGAIVATKDQLERYSESESRNKDMADTISKLNAEVASLLNEKTGLEERLSRTDSYANDLSVSMSKLQADLSAAHAATARSQAEASFHVQKVGRLEESLEATKKELAHLTTEKQRVNILNDNLQQRLSQYRDLESKLQEDLRQAQVQIRFAETKAASLTETESRLTADNNSLRSELARHLALQESIQKLEFQLSGRSAEDHDRLEDEVTKLTSLLQSERTKFTLEKEKLENLLADAELRMKDAEKNKLEVLTANLKTKEDLAMAEADKKLLRDRCESLEKSLATAKATVEESETDNDDKQTIQSLTLEIQTLKEELQAATQKVEDFKKMAKESENTLVDSTNANRVFKEATSAEIEKLRNDLKAANEVAIAKQKAFEDLSNDLNSKKSGHDKTLGELKAKVESLEIELKSSVANQEAYKKQYEEVKSEILIYKADIRASNNNYERELALHAEARRELQRTREALESESRLLRDAQLELENVKSEIEKEKSALAEANQHTMDVETEDQNRLKELNEQNKILHNQISFLNEVIEKHQADKLAAVSSEAPGSDRTLSTEDVTILSKQVAELREVLRYVRNEKDIVETQLQSARRNAEAERAAAEIAKRSLEQLRIEIDLLAKSKSESGSTANDILIIESKLKQAEDQVDLLKESNRLLREETGRLQEFISKAKNESSDMSNKLESAEHRCLVLETDKSALEAEKKSLDKELEEWKDRVKNLVTQFHQIDPEEHENALKQLQQRKEEIVTLQTEHNNVERECASAKGLVVKLNKKIQEMKSQLDASKTALEKANAEKDLLVKSSEGSANVEKEAQELKKKFDSVLAEKAILEKRMEHLKIILRNNKTKSNETQQKLQEALQAEKEARNKVQQEKESFEAKLKEMDTTFTKPKNIPEETQIVNQMDSEQVDKMEVEATSENVVADESAARDNSKPNTAEAEDEVVPVLPIPTVPKEGFKFIASKVSGENTSHISTSPNPNDDVVGQTSSETNMSNSEVENSKSASETTEKSSLQTSVPVPTKTIEITENSTDRNSTQTSKETSLKEKLLEKKRKMAESLAAQKMALQASVANAPKTDSQEEDTKDADVDKKNESTANSETSVPVEDSPVAEKDDANDKNQTEPEGDGNDDLQNTEEEGNPIIAEEEHTEENDEVEPPQKQSKTVFGSSLNPAAEPFKMFGSGSSAPVFGQGSSAPVFGTSAPATGTGGFLNLKPPGSGPAVPLTFGSSANITIPTPSKDPLPVESQSFSAFRGTSFPFGAPTTSQAQAIPLFGSSSNTGKKRSLDTDETQTAENTTSTKLARVEEEKGDENKGDETNTVPEPSIEDTEKDDVEE